MLRYTNYWMLFIVGKLLEQLMAGGESFEIFLHISACVKGTDVQVWDVTQLNEKDAVEVSGLNPHQMETDNGSQAFAVSSGGKGKVHNKDDLRSVRHKLTSLKSLDGWRRKVG